MVYYSDRPSKRTPLKETVGEFFFGLFVIWHIPGKGRGLSI